MAPPVGFLLVVACVVGRAPTAHASPLLELIGDTGASGGLQARTVPAGSAAAYFNPALLTDAPGGIMTGFMVLTQQISIAVAGRPGPEYAVPDGVGDAVRGAATGFARFDGYPLPTDLLQYGREAVDGQTAVAARPRQAQGSGHTTLTYEVFGIVVKVFDERLTIGVHGLIPNGEFTNLRAYWNDEREQYFSNSLHPELYGERMTALSLAVGAGLEITDGLSLGMGATLGLAAGVDAGAFVSNASELDELLLNINAGVNISITPHFGLTFEPSARWRFSATAQAPKEQRLEAEFTFQLVNGAEQSSGLEFVLNYMPWQFSAGTSYDLVHESDQTLGISGTVLYSRWSSYIDRHGERPSPTYSWSDTLSPVLGLRYRLRDVTTFVDASYTPTPVPAQTGRTNYVDSDRVSGSAGLEYNFDLWGQGMRVGLQAQVHHLLSRNQFKIPTPTSPTGENLAPELVKDEVPDDARISGDPLEGAAGLQTNNPGWPGFKSEGWILGATLYLSANF